MAKVTLNQALRVLQGKLGGIVFKQVNGKVFATRRPQQSRKPRTAKQKAWNLQFFFASEFAKSVKHHPELLAFYEPIARARKCRIREVVLSDAFSAPIIESVDLVGYTAQPGGEIVVRASDNFGVVSVTVKLVGGDGQVEHGPATLHGETWRYATTRELIRPVTMEITAHDRPHNRTTVTRVYPENGDSGTARPSP